MFKRTVLSAASAAALTLAVACPLSAHAADDAELAQLRNEVKQMKENYEARIRALEQRLQAAQPGTEPSAAPMSAAPAAASASINSAAAAGEPSPAPTYPAALGMAAVDNARGSGGGGGFNPAVSLILGGAYANLSQDTKKFRMQGFLPSGEEVGPGKRSLNLGESELTLASNIDPYFSGQMSVALAPDNSVSVEEAFFQRQGLSNGLNLKAGRFLSAIGYLNSQHAHAWDFVDAPLAYQAFFGGQYNPDGVQLRWLAPTERFFELGAEAGSGRNFPGNDRNKNGVGAASLFAHVGDDIGDSASWRAGLSYLRTSAANRSYDDVAANGAAVTNAFTGNSDTWIADGIYKWSPNGNATQTNFKLQGEYFRRNDRGTLAFDTASQSPASGNYSAAQSGWYLQGVYQFMPAWRVGLRYDKLYSGNSDIALLNNGAIANADLGRLAAYNPSRATLMIDYSPSEFSRFRLQLARDQSQPGVTDNQIYLQYIMSLGAHGAHTF